MFPIASHLCCRQCHGNDTFCQRSSSLSFQRLEVLSPPKMGEEQTLPPSLVSARPGTLTRYPITNSRYSVQLHCQWPRVAWGNHPNRRNGKWRQRRSAALQPPLHSISRVPAREHGPFSTSRRLRSHPTTSLNVCPPIPPMTCIISSFCPLLPMDDESEVSHLSHALFLAPSSREEIRHTHRDSHRRSDLEFNHGRPRSPPTSPQPSSRTPSSCHGRPSIF